MQAALEVARFNLEQTRILAPIDGVIINRDIAPGQTVAASLEAPTLFTIAGDLANIAVFARVDEADIGLVKPGQHVSFEVDAFPGRIFAGRVEQVRKSPSMIQNVVTYTVVISAENQDLLLLPGMTSLVRITVLETGELLRIPNAALRFRPQRDGQTGEPGNRVWTLDADGELLAVAITIGAADASHTELIAGDLQAGQQVVLRRAPRSGPSPSSGLKLGF
jgi:HlyD family secretion protein